MMEAEQIILWVLGALVGVGGFIAALSKTIIPRIVDARIAEQSSRTNAEIEAASYERARETFRQDTTFELLKETLAYLLKELESDREEAKEARDQQAELIKAINRVAANVDQFTQVQRLIVQNLTKFDDRLERIERVLNIELPIKDDHEQDKRART